MKINFITLGCAKNLVDTEHLMAQAAASGVEIVFDSDQDCDVAVVNTCGFIADAKEESVETILSLAQAKEEGRIQKLYVTGCLSERYRNELKESIPEADGIFGVNEWPQVIAALGREWQPEKQTQRKLTTPAHYAYLKISEGCSRGCGFCIIPYIRGKHVSVPMETLLEEARNLAAGGVKELIVIAQDTTQYGLDLYGERRLGTLLHELCKIDGIRWIRLMYAYPADFPEDVIEAMATEPRIARYLDIPLQHISDNVLKRMRRGIDAAGTEALVKKLRERVPGIVLRTTLLTGYPGETAAEHKQLKDFVARTKFERLGIFTYSEEEGTYSASAFPDDIPEDVKSRRAEQVMEIQREISHEYNLGRVGELAEAVIDRREGDYWIARSRSEAPEVDGEILIESSKPLRPGQFVKVRITSADEYDLFAELA